ncbi:MAG: S8 family peptidase [Myxococcales bacterium]|nr:S8 family peptidase [Myxococcales bacterium]
MRAAVLLLALSCLACSRGVEMAPPPPQQPSTPPPPRPASVSGTVEVFVSASGFKEARADARISKVRAALGLSAGSQPVPGAKEVLARYDEPPAKEVQPPTQRQSPIIAGDFIVGAQREPDAVLAALRPARLGLDCEVKATTEGRLHLMRCARAGGRPLTDAETRAFVDGFGRPAGIDFIETNGLQQAFRAPNDTLYSQQWHYSAIALPQTWELTIGRPEVVVAVLDSGRGSHADLDANMLPGIDLISDPAIALDGDGRDGDPTDEAGTLDSRQGGSGWHGTHVAGTIAALSNNGRGVAGVAWNSRIVPVRVLGQGGGTVFDIASGITWATGGAISGASPNQNVAHVVNMSLGGEGAPSQTYQTVIDAAVARGTIIVVAAGNKDTNTANFNPCNQANLICVGAVDLRGKATQYTNYGSEVTISAPGGATERDDDGDGYPDGVLSTLGDGTYGRMQGTSMASPHVAGVVALMRAVRPTLTLAEARQALADSASPISNCTSACGAGVVDAWKAVSAVHPSNLAVPPVLSINVTALVVTKEAPQQTIRLTNRGGSPASVRFFGDGSDESRSVYWNAPEVPLSLAAGQSVDLTVSFDAEITRDLEIPLSFACPESEAAFLLRVRAPRPPPRTVVMLMYQDGEDWKVAGDTQMESDSSYRIPDVAPGAYFLVGISDDDGDGRFEDNEGFGLWPSLDDPQQLQVAAGMDYADYDFSVSPSEGS